MEKLTALGILEEKGLSEAVRIFPDYAKYLVSIKDADLKKVREQLIKPLV